MRKDLLAEVSASDIGRQAKQTRQTMPEMEVEERVGNFEEVALGFSWNEAKNEWSRCLSCGCLKVDDCRLREYCSEYGVELDALQGQGAQVPP